MLIFARTVSFELPFLPNKVLGVRVGSRNQ
jgi:hypothetical protein